jgi:hypothetical protein
MAKLINLSINLPKIDKTKIISGEKGKYLNLTIAVNDEKDKYDNDVSAWQGQTEQERKDKKDKNYLGNGKVFWTNDNTNQNTNIDGMQTTDAANDEHDDLPF